MEEAHYSYVIDLLEREKNRQIDKTKKYFGKNPCVTNQCMIKAQAIESAIKVLKKNQKKEN